MEEEDEDDIAAIYCFYCSYSQNKCPEVLMSHSASESDIYARLFFLPNELYPDPMARSLLPFLPEARLYFNIVDKEGENGG